MKVGIISSNYNEIEEYEGKEIITYIKKYFSEYVFFNLKKISIVIHNNEVKVIYYNNGKIIDLSSFDTIIIRRTRGAIEQIIDIVTALEKTQNPPLILDSPESLNSPTSKIKNILLRKNLYYQPSTQIINDIDECINCISINLPLILKPSHGMRGLGVYLCYSKEDIDNAILNIKKIKNKDNNFLGYGILVQEYINFDKEFRVNVVNGKGIGCVVKNSNKVTKNAYQGAKFYKTNNEEVIKIAEQVSKTHKLFFAGVDIIEKNGKYYVLECNRNPAFKEFDKALNIKTADYFIKNVYYESIKFNKNK